MGRLLIVAPGVRFVQSAQAGAAPSSSSLAAAQQADAVRPLITRFLLRGHLSVAGGDFKGTRGGKPYRPMKME